MIGIARKREGCDNVVWINSGAVELALDARFDLIIMTGHVFQSVPRGRRSAHGSQEFARASRTRGCLAFETRNALVKGWETWADERYEPVAVGNDTVEVRYRIRSVDGRLVTFETHYRFVKGDTVVAPHTLRFMEKDELATFLAGAGFSEITWHGDWDRSPFTPASPEIIAIAQ